MDLKLRRQLRLRLVCLERRQGHLGFERRPVIPSLSSHSTPVIRLRTGVVRAPGRRGCGVTRPERSQTAVGSVAACRLILTGTYL